MTMISNGHVQNEEHIDTSEELSAMLADESPHSYPQPSESVQITIPSNLKLVDINHALLDEIKGIDTNEEDYDPDELIRSHDPEHVSLH